MKILVILFLYFYQIFAASLLENACNAYKTAVNYTTSAFFDNHCFLILRIIGISYLNIKPMCDETMKPASGLCNVIQFNGSADVQDFLISQLQIRPNDRFYTGLSREDCSSPWLWRNYNNTTRPFESTIISMPDNNVDCNQTIQGYNSGSLGPVNGDTFNASAFICECYESPTSLTSTTSSIPFLATTPLISTTTPLSISTTKAATPIITTTTVITTTTATTTAEPTIKTSTPRSQGYSNFRIPTTCCYYFFCYYFLLFLIK